MIHPSDSIHNLATAHENMRVINKEKLGDLKNSVLEFFRLISEKGFPVSQTHVQNYLTHCGLKREKFIERFTVTPG
jgi:hypothetical protein